MASGILKTGRRLEDVADEQMQRWFLSPEFEAHMQTARVSGRLPNTVGPHITISREAGAGGETIGRAVAERLGWDVLDKELLDFMAQREGLSRKVLEMVDETKANWVEDIFGGWFDRQVVSHEKYLVHLHRLLWVAAMHGRVVFIGRGAEFVLPRNDALAVRLIAPFEYRARQLATAHHVTMARAEEMAAALDKDRRDFIRTFFHRDVGDPHCFDLVLNVARLGPALTVEQILQAWSGLHAKAGK